MESLRCKILQTAVLLVLVVLQIGAEHLGSEDCGCGRRG
ncbi:uncharacterized protein [Drosophila bipectinata]|nr:uncharacterized protein LOC108124753 [Drosophila bipectinata]